MHIDIYFYHHQEMSKSNCIKRINEIIIIIYLIYINLTKDFLFLLHFSLGQDLFIGQESAKVGLDTIL